MLRAITVVAMSIVLLACAGGDEDELLDVARTAASRDLRCDYADIEIDASTAADGRTAGVVAAGCGHAAYYKCRARGADRKWSCYGPR